MSIPMIITFRESLEAILMIVPLIIYLTRVEQKHLSKYIYFGSLLGLITSIFTGTVLYDSVQAFEGYSQQLFQGGMMIFLAGIIVYSISVIGKLNKEYAVNKNTATVKNTTGVNLFLMTFLTVFRESLEVIIFLLALTNTSATNIIIGIIAGLILAACLGFIIFKTSLKINLNIVFSFLTLMLIFIGSSMFAEGLIALFPSLGEASERSAQILYSVPLLYIFIKRELKKYINKLNNK